MSEILFADIDPANVEKEIITTYETIAQTILYPGDPVRLFLEAIAYTLAIQNNVINLAGRQNLLAYAVGAHLDYIGMMVGTKRQGASSAICRQAFYIGSQLDFSIHIPKGTRVTTSDGRAQFATEEDGIIEAGNTSCEVVVKSIVPGASANGLLPGQINQLIDPIAYVSKTANISISLMGSDIESDERYRSRIQAAPEAFSCAGPVGAYRHYTLAAHPDIAACAIWTPIPGTVDVRPVMEGGELPNEEILEAVKTALNAENVRPLSDTVTVQAPELVYFDIDFTWYLPKAKEAFLGTITAAIGAAVEDFRIWQRTSPGRDIYPLKLQSLLEQAGAIRVDLQSPEYVKLEGWQLARERQIRFTFGGVVD